MLEIGGPHGELQIFQGKTQAWENWEKESTTLTAWFRTTHTLTKYILHTITLVRAHRSLTVKLLYRQTKKAQSERSNRVTERGKKSQRDWSTSLKQARAPGTDIAELSWGSTGMTTHLGHKNYQGSSMKPCCPWRQEMIWLNNVKDGSTQTCTV